MHQIYANPRLSPTRKGRFDEDVTTPKTDFLLLLFRYIFSLALADLLVITTCVPFTSILYTLESWPWGVVMCKVSETSKLISIGVSVFTLTALSAERYCAIVNPLRRLQVSLTATQS
jgi:hypothetical protein